MILITLYLQLDMRKRMRGNVTKHGESIFNNEDFQSSNNNSNNTNNNSSKNTKEK